MSDHNPTSYKSTQRSQQSHSNISHLAPEGRQDLAELNPDILKKHPKWASAGKWQGRFNIAVWMRFPEGLLEPVQLLLCYRDSERRKTVAVDICQPNRQTLILLNGSVSLQVTGRVMELSLQIQGPSERTAWILDEKKLEPKVPASALRMRRAT